MSEQGCFVSVVAVLADAEAFVEDFVRECGAVLRAHYRDYELILVDDGSTDATAAIVDALLHEELSLRLIRLARRFGPDVALTAGLDSAIGDCIVLMEAEGDPPAEVPALVRLVRSGRGVVTGVSPRRQGEPRWRRLLRRGFYRLCNRRLGIGYPAHATRFQAFSRLAATAVARVRHKAPQFPVLAWRVGYGSATHRYRQAARPGGRKPGLFEKIDRALSILALNSLSPLRLVSRIGIVAGLLNLLYALYVAGVNVFRSHVAEGWTTLSLQISSMFFLVFLILVVVCEYVGHTLEETQDRPPYHVLEERNSSEILPLDRQRNVTDKAA